MTVTNNNKPMDMKQIWQQMEPAPVASAALSALCAPSSGDQRFMYYLTGTTFFRYDTYANTWQKLASPIVTPTVFESMRYASSMGYFGKVILCPANNMVRIPGISFGMFVGKTIRIISGTGAGQTRTITVHAPTTQYEQGLATTASTTTIGDSTKKWSFNQWVGYKVRLTYSTGQTQIRKISYNDATTLYIADTNHQQIDPYNNAAFVTAPVTTAGSQTHFVIEASTLVVDTDWTINPDYTSGFVIETGGIWLFSGTTTPFMAVQYYDVAADYWMSKTVPTGLVLAAMTGTDGSFERIGNSAGAFESGTASSGGTYTLTDSSKTFTAGKYINYAIRITGGIGAGQVRRIIYNGVDYIEVANKWEINPDNTSIYEVIADVEKNYIVANSQAVMFQYDEVADLFLQGSKWDDGIANNLAAKLPGVNQNPIAITSGTRTTTGITSVNAVPTNKGTNYLVGDILTCTTGGTNGKVIVTSTSPGGLVEGISLIRGGSGYTTGSGKATSGGSGTSCTIEILTTGTICLVVTAINHFFKIGDQVVLSGDSAYAGTVTITGVDSLTQFDFATAAAGNMTAANSNSATLIVDSTKNWTTDELVGKIIQTQLVGLSGVITPRRITANTATTITVDTITTPLVNGTGRYAIVCSSAFGKDEQYKVASKQNIGMATSGSTVTLVDTSKNWNTNQWAGARMKIDAGTGRGASIIITSNTANTLTIPTQTFSPDTTTRYRIQDTWGVCTGAGSTTTLVDTTKTWAVNQWAGKRVRITGGAGFGLAAAANEILIVSNTATTLTFAAITGFAPDATTTYTILGIPARGLGIELVWIWGGISAGKYLFSPRGGGSNTADRYDIGKETYDYGMLSNPQTDTMTTGTSYAYDGNNRIYLTYGVATGIVQYICYFDLTTSQTHGFGSIPNTQLAPVLGNLMEIIESPEGLQYVYHLRNTGTEMYRAMIWF